MTGTAGLAVLHVLHSCLVCATLGLEQTGVAAVAAAKHLDVDGVGEGDIPCIFVLEDDVTGMTSGAFSGGGYAEGCFAVVAGAAGFTLRHGTHSGLVGTLLGLEQIGMATVAAAKHLDVDGV